MSALFELKNIGYRYQKEHAALNGIDLSITQGEITSIVGSNGSGKSTLLNILCGLVFPSEGTIAYKNELFNEKILKDNRINQQFRSSIGYIFQHPDAQLFCPTVFDELLFGPLQLGISKEQAHHRAEEVMQMLHIEHLKDRPVYMLSGGEKKRVAIGAVLTSNPETLVIDEPVSGLDPKTRSFLIDLMFKLNDAGKTIILATHHLELVNHLKANMVVLSEKHSVERTGKCDEILSDTEFLLKMNLIGEYPHRHSGTIHKHLENNFLFHSHGEK
ncbi:MAG: energy-coupling factor ABC transporter ATP-binding protein [Prolixibacteraceae bacterium]